MDAFEVLEPAGDGFRNYCAPKTLSPETRLLDRANLLKLTAPEMTALVGGMRALDANHRAVDARRLHRPAGDADQRLLREPARHWHGVETVGFGRERLRRTAIAPRASRSGPPRRPTSCSARTRSFVRWRRSTPATTRKEKFVRDFVAAWNKVMNLDRYDLLAQARQGNKRAGAVIH